jgi:outer membrane protein
MRPNRVVLLPRLAVLAGMFAAAPCTTLAQTPALEQSLARSAQGQAASTAPQVRRLTVEEAVRLALENNLGILVARYEPRVQDLSVAQAQAGWFPSLTSSFQTNSQDSPNNSLLAGAQGNKTSNDRFLNSTGFQKNTKRGGTYSLGWDASRLTTNNAFTTFSPQLQSTVSFSATQPLLRDFSIDSLRQQLQVSVKNREISDVQLRQTLATTLRSVRNAYWNLVYAAASLQVQQQSLDLAQESLRNTRARVEIGTTPPIDIVESEAEVSQREEAVILAEAQIASAEDTLRTLVYDPAMPDFWTIRIEAVDRPSFQAAQVDIDAAVRNALDRRTDVQQSRKTLEVTDINIRFFRNQALPSVVANFDYGLSGLGGTQLVRGLGPFGPGSGEVTGLAQRGFGSVLGDLFTNDFPNWTASLNISYPIGPTPADSSLARARLQYSQSQAQLRNQELQITTQVREQGRQVLTNQKRVDTTRTSRALAERRLEAEQRKLAAGTSTNFFVFQAQRDLAQARNNELRAILDFTQSVVDLETVQEVPITATPPRQ